MPTIHGMDLPKPEHWQEFEHMTRDAMALRWNSPNLQMNGRPGQKQNGVDIFGFDELGRRVGIQCKRYKPPLTLKTVQEEIGNAESFTPPLTTLFVATTAEFDGTLQQQVRLLSEDRCQNGKFAVGLLFWKDVVTGLTMNPTVFMSHYPNIVFPAAVGSDPERQIAALELGFFGGRLWDYVLLIHGEFGWMAQEDPDELTARLRILEHRAAQLLTSHDAGPLVESCQAVRLGCLTPKADEADWHPIEMHAKRVQTRIAAATSFLAGGEAQALELGLMLSRIYFRDDDELDQVAVTRVTDALRKLFPSAAQAIDALIEEVKHIRAAYEWALRIYGFADRQLRWS